MSETSPINLLRQVAYHASYGLPLPAELAAWFVVGQQRYERAAQAGQPIGLDVALGLGAPGRHGWWTLEARARRDSLLRDLRDVRFADFDDAEAARRIQTMFRGGIRHPLMTEALCSGIAMPGLRQLRTILSRKSAARAVFHEGVSTTVA